MKVAEDILKEKGTGLISIDGGSTVLEALKIMVERNIGSILVMENDLIVGIFTERDLLRHSVDAEFDPKSAKLGDVMSTNLLFANYDTPVYRLADVILGKFVRHLLVVKDGEYVGLLSAGDVMRASLNEKMKELASVSWNYYENWSWKKK